MPCWRGLEFIHLILALAAGVIYLFTACLVVLDQNFRASHYRHHRPPFLTMGVRRDELFAKDATQTISILPGGQDTRCYS